MFLYYYIETNETNVEGSDSYSNDNCKKKFMFLMVSLVHMTPCDLCDIVWSCCVLSCHLLPVGAQSEGAMGACPPIIVDKFFH